MVLSIWESGKTRICCQNLGFPKGEDFWLNSALEGKKSVLLITGGNIHKFGVQWVRGQDKLPPIKPIKMTKRCLFLPIINTAIIPNTLRMGIFTLAAVNITNRKRVIVFSLTDDVKS
jgi:hypothetical protein